MSRVSWVCVYAHCIYIYIDRYTYIYVHMYIYICIQISVYVAVLSCQPTVEAPTLCHSMHKHKSLRLQIIMEVERGPL